jgi:hypothetical protein
LLVAVPRDLSDHGVGVAHKAQAIYQEPSKSGKKKKAMMFHMDEGKEVGLIIPKSDYIDALAADAGNLRKPGAGKQLMAWCRDRSYLVTGDRIYDVPSGWNKAILTCEHKVQPSLQRRRGRHAMETVAEHGHTGEEAWTIMTMDGEKCVSSGVHILGVFVGTWAGTRTGRLQTTSAGTMLTSMVDTKNLLPCFMKAK